MVQHSSIESARTSLVTLAVTLGICLLLPTMSRGQDQPAPAAYYVIGHTPGEADWEIYGEYDENEEAVDAMKNLAAKVKRCTLLTMRIVSAHQPGALSIYEGKAHVIFEDLDYRDGKLVPGAANVFKSKLKQAIRRALDPDAPKTVGEELVAIPPRPRPTGRPVYVIAHRCNAVKEIEEALNAGANAIECDVRYKGKDGWVVQHDSLAGATGLKDWLTAAGNAKARHLMQFALIVFDIKTPDADAIADLHRQARAELPFRALPVTLIFSIADYNDRDKAFGKIKANLGNKDGLAIDQYDEPRQVQKYFAQELKLKNFWYGYGTFVLGIDKVEPYIREGCQLRDKDSVIKKVYVWTLRDRDSIARHIKDYKVDGVMVNEPTIADTVAIVKKHGRLATARDDPFSVYKP